MARVEPATPETILEAAHLLGTGGCVAFPTETVYGLGASTFDARALRAVYNIKGRPDDNPLIAHVVDVEMAESVVLDFPAAARALAAEFWPGPLTLILRRAPDVPAAAAAGRPTIAVRAPRHPVARDLLRTFGGAISAPSANRSGHVSPTTAAHVADDLGAAPDLLILDGGPTATGLESTVLDLTARPARILRRGAVTEPVLRDALGAVETVDARAQTVSPGTSPRHYAPDAPTEIVDPALLALRLEEIEKRCVVLTFDAEHVPAPHEAIEMPQSAGAYAARLYGALREAERAAPHRILVEAPPESNEIWKAVTDRLSRAAQDEARG